MKLGLSTLLLRDHALNRDLLIQFQQAGIEALELTDYHPGFSFDDTSSFVALGKAITELDLHLNSLHIHLEKFDPEFDLAALDTQQVEKSLAIYRLAVDDMAAMGGDILVTHDIRIPEPDEDQHGEKRAAFLDHLASIAAYAASQNVRLALENTGRGYTREPDRLVALMEDLAAPNVGVCIDTGHRNLVGDPAAALRTVGRHLITLHIHDNHGEADEHLLPGDGDISWPDIAQALRDIDYGGVFMYELSRSEHLSAARRNFESLDL